MRCPVTPVCSHQKLRLWDSYLWLIKALPGYGCSSFSRVLALRGQSPCSIPSTTEKNEPDGTQAGDRSTQEVEEGGPEVHDHPGLPRLKKEKEKPKLVAYACHTSPWEAKERGVTWV